MKIYINTLVKNEGTLLKYVLPFWENYPVDKFLFWDDNSTDNTIEIIKSILGNRAEIFESKEFFNEGKGRNFLAYKSKEENADLIISIDCDEILSRNFVDDFNNICSFSSNKMNLGVFQCNVVKNSLNFMRTDPMYKDNFRYFLIPVKFMELLPNCNDGIHSSQREPFVHLHRGITKHISFIHLQAINLKFYAYKQAYYKVDQILNKRGNYLQVIKDINEACNNYIFNEISTPIEYIGDWKFDPSVFDTILKERKYEEVVKNYIFDTKDIELCKELELLDGK